jgi:hypothetical protein
VVVQAAVQVAETAADAQVIAAAFDQSELLFQTSLKL